MNQAQAEIRWLEAAKKEWPEDAICFFCGKPNDFADDCGFFYLSPDGPKTYNASKPTCEACYRGEPGRKHVARYGVGER